MTSNNKIFCVRSQAVALLTLAAILFAGPVNAEDKGKEATDQAVYEAIGMMFAHGSGLTRMDFSEAEIASIVEGIRKGLKLKEIPPEVQRLEPKIQAIMQAKMMAARKAQQAEGAQLAAGNKLKGQQFLAEIAKKPGVLKDPSGFYYEILKVGEGPFREELD